MNKLLKEAMDSLALVGIYTTDGYKFEDPKEIEKAIKELEKSDRPDMQYLMALKRALELAKAERATKDNDATENGAIEEFGQNKETEAMPLEKKPVLAQDGDSLVGKNVWVRNKGQEWRVYVLQDKGSKLYIYDPYNGTQGWISRSAVTGLAGTKDDKFGTVMKEFYESKLKSGSGEKVTDPQQAKAIAYSESKDGGPGSGIKGHTTEDPDEKFWENKLREVAKQKGIPESSIEEFISKVKSGGVKKVMTPIKDSAKWLFVDLPNYEEAEDYIRKLKFKYKEAKIISKPHNGQGKYEIMITDEEPIYTFGDKNMKDEKTYQNGEHVKVKNHGTGEEIDLKVLKDNKDGTLEVKAPTGAVITVKKTWIVDAAYDPKKYEGSHRHETNIWYLENEVATWRRRYENAKDQIYSLRKMVSSGQYGKLTSEDLKKAERDAEAARMKLEQSLSMLQRAKGQKDEAPTILEECMEILRLSGVN